MFLTSSYYSEKSVKRAWPLNIVQSVQKFAHKLIFLCVTRAALWSHTFPTFSFLGHTTAQAREFWIVCLQMIFKWVDGRENCSSQVWNEQVRWLLYNAGSFAFKYGVKSANRGIHPPTLMMHIPYSSPPYINKIYKFSPCFHSFLFFGFPHFDRDAFIHHA